MTRSGPAARIGQQVLRRGGRVVLSRQADLAIHGAEHIPRKGPAVLVARHYHHLLDGCALYQATNRPIHMLVGLDWAGAGMTHRFMTTLCRLVEWPIVYRPDALDREDASPSRRAEARRLMLEATRQSIDLLASGELLVMFPEGYPVVDPHALEPRACPDGIVSFREGAGRLVSLAERHIGEQVPVVPIGFRYDTLADERWAIDMRIGQPLHRSDERTSDPFTNRLERTVRELSGVGETADMPDMHRDATRRGARRTPSEAKTYARPGPSKPEEKGEHSG